MGMQCSFLGPRGFYLEAKEVFDHGLREFHQQPPALGRETIRNALLKNRAVGSTRPGPLVSNKSGTAARKPP